MSEGGISWPVGTPEHVKVPVGFCACGCGRRPADSERLEARQRVQRFLDLQVADSTCLRWVVLTAPDGLPRHWSGSLPEHASRERLAVLAASLACLAHHAAGELSPGSGYQQVVVETPALQPTEGPSRLVIASCGHGCVAAGGLPGADASVIVAQVLTFVERLGVLSAGDTRPDGA